MDTEIAAVDRLIAQQALAWPEIRRLMTVSGVNLICAASFLAAIGEPSRFLTSRRLVAYLGLDLKGPPIRRDTGALRADLQARVGVRAVGAGRGGVERGQSSRPAARVLRAPPRPARSRQGDRRDRPQAHGPVLVHADPRRGLRPPTPRVDQEKAASARADRRRQAADEGRRHPLTDVRSADPRWRRCSVRSNSAATLVQGSTFAHYLPRAGWGGGDQPRTRNEPGRR
jgi:hypothetical protein